MKKLFLSLILLCTIMVVKAQKTVFVDSEYILSHVPGYTSAQKQLDATVDLWQKEVEVRQRDIDRLKESLQADMVLLTDELKQKREKEILLQEADLVTFQKTKFGYDGELFQERKKLMKPIQDKVALAIKVFADAEKVDIIIDKSSADGLILFGNPKYDKSDEVLKKMGYKPGIIAKIEKELGIDSSTQSKKGELKGIIDTKVKENTTDKLEDAVSDKLPSVD